MKKTSIIVQWFFAGLFALTALGTGSVVSSIIVLLAAVLMAPIKPIREAMKKIKIKSSVAIILSVVLLFAGVLTSPAADSSNTTGPPSVSDGVLDDSDDETEDSNSTAPSEKESASEKQSSESESSTNSSDTTEGTTASKPVGNGTAKPANPSSVPSYSGKAYVAVNNNQPNFSTAELTTKSYESYSPLDSLGRCGVAIASIGRDIMPTEDRGSIGQVKPSGWHTVKYDCVDGKYLYNRCHLIGYQLTGENANTRNLITGTRFLNIQGMLPFENMVADYVKETGNHVAYRVTPIFKGNNLLASGVQIEGYSIEDNGDGICFNVYCYNVQPGVTINYADGSSSLSGSTVTTTKPETTTKKPEGTTQRAETTTREANTDVAYVLNTNSMKFHYPTCSSAKTISPENYAESNKTRDQLIADGYDPCGRCHP